MAAARHYLALDVGASSGRAMLGRFDGGRLEIAPAHRFDSSPVRTPAGLFVDDLGIFREILGGMRAARGSADAVRSVGIDTWGVTFALVDRLGQVCGHPVHYRDGRSARAMEEVYRRASRTWLYERTGVQELPFNASFMLAALSREPSFAAADRLLMLPDLFSAWLCGVAAVERTNASTTQLYDDLTRDWAWPVIDRLGLPRRLFAAPLVCPGLVLGSLTRPVAEETGLPASISVVAVGSHDTASAVAGVPAEGTCWAYLSSGTWSLLGVERDGPVRTPAALAANLTNEVGVGGRTRLLRNVMGLWLVQECRRTWSRGGNGPSYAELSAAAAAAPAFGPIVDPDHPSLFAPGDLPARIRELCRASGQPEPTTRGETIRCALESLALKYRWTVRRLEEVTGDPIRVLHVVGGGAQDRLLCQLTADACSIPVLAGPAEATAVGNLLVQAMADGEVGDLDEARQIVRRSFRPDRYEPATERARWDEAAGVFDRLLEMGG